MLRPGGSNPAIPAGYTYLGQFVDHDITLDVTSLTEVALDPSAIYNFRTPRLDLDSVYGLGPAVMPYLYERANPAKLVVGLTGPPSSPTSTAPNQPNDVARASNLFALVGDHRNDENLIVSQLHTVFLKFHNAVVDKVVADGTFDAFADARQLATWHYQWIVLHDFLSRLLDPAVLRDVLTNGRKFYAFGSEDGATSREPFIPVEFAVAAYRLGHSMVREEYDFNEIFRVGGLTPATLGLLFTFSGIGGGVVPVPGNWIIDWTRFFPISAQAVNESMLIDTSITPALGALLPAGGPSLPERNLLQGRKAGLPSGQDVASRMGILPLSRVEMLAAPEGPVLQAHGLLERTPLWYYILREADIQQAGQRLGAVGSRIVAEVFVGLLEGDPASFVSRQPTWVPTLGPVAGQFTMSDLINFVNDPLMTGSQP